MEVIKGGNEKRQAKKEIEETVLKVLEEKGLKNTGKWLQRIKTIREKDTKPINWIKGIYETH